MRPTAHSPRVSVDTSVVVEASQRPSSTSGILFRRAMEGAFEVAASTRLAYQLQQPIADPELAAFVASLTTIPSTGRYGVSTYGGGDVYPTHPDARPDVGMGSKLDDDHLESHRASGREHFVTLDEGQRKRAINLGMSALTPVELLDLYPAADKSQP